MCHQNVAEPLATEYHKSTHCESGLAISMEMETEMEMEMEN